MHNSIKNTKKNTISPVLTCHSQLTHKGGSFMDPNVIIIKPNDNVAVTLRDIQKGEPVLLPDSSEFPALSDIPYSHKVALKDIEEKKEILKYGEVIGHAKETVKKGDWVHTHNIIIEGE